MSQAEIPLEPGRSPDQSLRELAAGYREFVKSVSPKAKQIALGYPRAESIGPPNFGADLGIGRIQRHPREYQILANHPAFPGEVADFDELCIHRTVGGAIPTTPATTEQSGGTRVCRQRAAHRARFWQLQPSEAGRVSFQLCTADDISTLRGHCRAQAKVKRTLEFSNKVAD